MSRENDYDNKGLLIERRECMSGLCTDKNLYTYDSKGFVVEENRYSKDLLVSKITYKNNDKGNDSYNTCLHYTNLSTFSW